MSYESYSLEIVSKLPEFNLKTLKKYHVEGLDTVGVWGNEPFEIHFKNNTWQNVQVKITLDGTDVLTGKIGTTEVSKEMWFVPARQTLVLQAWPETSNGGAQFVFTDTKNSVASHTHGNLSSNGIIAAAIYVEGYVEPIRYTNYNYSFDNFRFSSYDYNSKGTCSDYSLTSSIGDCFGVNGGIATNSIDVQCSANSGAATATKSIEPNVLRSRASVGAGEYTNQKLSYVQGLKKPIFNQTIRVKYVWWDDLVAKLKESNSAMQQASGFPGDKDQKMSLGTTPKISGYKHNSFTRSSELVYVRF
jgi:hypothetical protein